MLKIATHNSATGEKGKGLLSFLVTPFAKTQSKTLKEQLNVGVTAFDLRVRRTKEGYNVVHGFWTCSKTLEEILTIINAKKCYVSITYEDVLDDEDDFIKDMEYLVKFYPNIKLSFIAVKKPQWHILLTYDKNYSQVSEYVILDGSTWKTYIPIPWLWNKFYYKNVEFNEEVYKSVDFI